jgi:hypothetical protein
MRLALALLVAVAPLALPGAAAARWIPPAPVPYLAGPNQPASGMAVADDGRVAVAYPAGDAAAIGILPPGGALSAVPLPAVQQPVAPGS